MFQLNGKKISIHQDLIVGEGDAAITYPVASLQNADLRAELGIVELPDPVRPDERFWSITDAADGSLSAEPKDLADLRQTAIADVKRLRQSALDTFPRSTGVSEVYAENLRAAQALTSGGGATTIMRDGSTAEAYLGAMAAGMGITAAQFAAYVLAENTAAAVKAREIEAEYVRLAYTFIPGCSFEQVQLVADGFRDFCAARTA